MMMGLGAKGPPAQEEIALGLSPLLDTVTGQNAVWSQRIVDVSNYSGVTAYLVFEYANGSSFTGDIQLDSIDIGGNLYTFDSSVESFERNSNLNSSTYDTTTWTALTTGTSGGGSWLRDSGGTASSNTGLTTAAGGFWYVYAETSNPAAVAGYKFWLRSPSVVINSDTFSYYEARSGAGIGTLNVYLDVIST
jgi:hypothetical protein